MTIRRSTSKDLASIREVALLDSQRPPRGPFLVAEVDDDIVAALVIDNGLIIANPFMHTADAVALLELVAEQLTASRKPQGRTLSHRRLGNAAAEAR